LIFYCRIKTKGVLIMNDKKIFCTKRAPEPKGPYSQAVIHNGLLYISGQVPIDPVKGELLRGTIEEETEVVLNNIKIIVEEAGAGIKDVLKVTCYLADMADFNRFNTIYKTFFQKDPPARTALQAGRLPLDVQVEVDAIVALPRVERGE
jgi:2-iminobutanoate/2-iminopropanoate deaminase